MEHTNNCNALLFHLVKSYVSYEYSYGDHIMFQGGLCEIGNCTPDRWTTLMTTPKFPNIIFAIGTCNEEDKFFLCISSENHSILGSLAVKLPDYVKNELITTIVGYDIRSYFN